MGTANAESCTLTSTSQFSPPILLDPLAKVTSVQVTITSPSLTAGVGNTFYVEATLDGNGAFSAGSGGLLPQPQPIWGQVGSSVYSIVTSSLSVTTYTNISAFDNSNTFALMQVVGGLRLASSAAGGIPAGTTVTLRALQSPSA